jgi:hypothetical protein
MPDESKTVDEPELIDEHALELRKPGTPTSVTELAALAAKKGVAIIDARSEILQTLRIASIKLTMPSDWTLFRAVDERGESVTAFLGDQGCDRIKKLWGIQIDHLSKPELIEDPDTKEYAYRITGDGRCSLTGEAVYDMEGVRYSSEKYAFEKPEGIQRRVAVRKAARANLDGGITRELAGMKAVPVEELDKAWEGGWRKSSMCAKGKGFGSKDQRMGRGDEKTGEIDPADIPTCDICRVKLVYRPAKRFWGCPSYQKHPNEKIIVNHDDLLKQIAERRKAANGQREPGDEA